MWGPTLNDHVPKQDEFEWQRSWNIRRKAMDRPTSAVTGSNIRHCRVGCTWPDRVLGKPPERDNLRKSLRTKVIIYPSSTPAKKFFQTFFISASRFIDKYSVCRTLAAYDDPDSPVLLVIFRKELGTYIMCSPGALVDRSMDSNRTFNQNFDIWQSKVFPNKLKT